MFKRISEIGVKTVSFWQQKFEQNTVFHWTSTVKQLVLFMVKSKSQHKLLSLVYWLGQLMDSFVYSTYLLIFFSSSSRWVFKISKYSGIFHFSFKFYQFASYVLTFSFWDFLHLWLLCLCISLLLFKNIMSEFSGLKQHLLSHSSGNWKSECILGGSCLAVMVLARYAVVSGLPWSRICFQTHSCCWQDSVPPPVVGPRVLIPYWPLLWGCPQFLVCGPPNILAYYHQRRQ